MLWLLGEYALSLPMDYRQPSEKLLSYSFFIVFCPLLPHLSCAWRQAPGVHTIDIYEGNNKWKKNSVVLLRVGKKCVHDGVPCGGRRRTALKTRSVPLSSTALSSLMNKFFDLFIPQGCLQSCIHLQHKVNINHGVLGSINLTEAEDIKKRWQEYTE